MSEVTHLPSLGKKSAGFVVVGATGFSIDAVLLHWLLDMGTSQYLARIFSIACAMTVTWLLNRQFSFGKSAQGPAAEFARYAFVAFVAAAVNYGVYAALVGSISPFLAMVAGSVVAMSLSFLGYDRWVFGK
jgi:putative flippase GtrA